MIESKYINVIIIALMLVAVIFTLIITFNPPNSVAVTFEDPEYVSRLFDKERVIDINIDIDQEDWDWIIENALEEEYRSADITVAGETFYNVGIRPKGNSSLKMVASNPDSDRYSFKIEFDQYIEGQTCYGLDKLALNNMFSDVTYMKEYLSYELFAMMGVVIPLYSYANVTVNGEPWGLYLMVEVPEESYLQRNFGSTLGKLYKPEGRGSDLLWTGDNVANYSGIRENAVGKVTDSDFARVMEMIRNLNAGTNLEEYLDVDAVLRYFAVNIVLVNMDSYAGNSRHNYYLYEENGVCTILPWDLNQSFAGFQINSGRDAINFSIDKPVAGNLEDYPLIGKLLQVPEYEELYRQYLAEAVQLYFDSGFFSASIDKLDWLIGSYVQNDSTAFYTYEQYRQSLLALKEFGELRGESVTAQLAGNTEIIDTDFNLSLLGKLGGGGGMDRAGGQANLPDNGARRRPAAGQNVLRERNEFRENEMFPEEAVPAQRDRAAVRPVPEGLPGNNIDRLPGNMGNGPGGQGIRPGRSEVPTGSISASFLELGKIVGSGILFLAAGILFAVKFPRRKYVIPK